MHKLLRDGYLGILTDLGMADHSIPLTLWHRLTADSIGLSEFTMRLPGLAAGVSSLLLVTLFFWKVCGRKPALLTAWLLAISPFHIYFSRLARPYAVSMLFSFMAIALFFLWYRDRKPVWAAGYVSAAVMAPYFHLSSLPMTLAPLLYPCIRHVLRAQPNPPIKEVIRVGAWTMTGLAFVLTPPFLTNPEALIGKLATSNPLTMNTWVGAAELLLGMGSPLILLIEILLLLTGCALVFRQHAWLGLYLTHLVAVQLLAVMVIQPAFLEEPVVLARYLFVCLPILLFWIGFGLNGLDDLMKSKFRMLPFGAAPAVILLIAVQGPLPEIYFRPNNWTNQIFFHSRYNPEKGFERFRPKAVSPFYFQLRNYETGSRKILEAPWYFDSHAFPHLQKIHRQQMLIGFVDDLKLQVRPGEIPVIDPRFKFANFLHVSDHIGIARKGVHFVLFHKNLKEEMPMYFDQVTVDVQGWIRHYERVYGPPVYEDYWLTVFPVSPASGRPSYQRD